MPTYIKIIISITVVLVLAVILYFYRAALNPAVPGFVLPSLACLMTAALWLFPEAAKRPR